MGAVEGLGAFPCKLDANESNRFDCGLGGPEGCCSRFSSVAPSHDPKPGLEPAPKIEDLASDGLPELFGFDDAPCKPSVNVLNGFDRGCEVDGVVSAPNDGPKPGTDPAPEFDASETDERPSFPCILSKYEPKGFDDVFGYQVRNNG